MNSKKLNIVRAISLLISFINVIILGCNIFEIFSFPDTIIRISGVLTLIAIAAISYTAVKKAQNAN